MSGVANWNVETAAVADGAAHANNPILRKLEGFGSLTEGDRILIQDLVPSERRVPARTELLREGDKPNCVHVVTSGLACRYKRLANGKRQIVAFLLPGDFCDPHTFILQAIDYSIGTLAPSDVAEVPREAILELLGRPNLSDAMFRAALADGAILRAWVANIGQRPAEHRIAHLFCELHARLWAVGRSSGGIVHLPINQTELSSAVGLSLVHTNKSLRALKERELIFFGSDTLVIRDLRRLEALCGFSPNYLHLA